MKKLTFIIIALLVLSLCGCVNQVPDEHVHAYGEWQTVTEASCTSDGSAERSCACGDKESKIIGKTGHTEKIIPGVEPTCTTEGLTEGKKCSVCGEIIVDQEAITVLPHTEEVIPAVEPTCTTEGLTEGKKCSVCEEILVDQEKLPIINHIYKYTEKTDEKGNIITMVVCQRENCAHTSTNTAGLYDDEGILLASWNGFINNYGLNGLYSFNKIIKENENLASVTTIIIDDSITAINLYLFEESSNITTIIIPSSVTSIGNPTTIEPIYFKNIIVDEDNENYKSIDGNLYNKDGTELILYAAGKEEKEFIIPDGVTRIYYYSIVFCDKIETVVIPSSVTQIDNGFLYSCASLKDIYFNGSAEEWEAIKNKSNWLPYNALVHYDGNKMFMAYGFAGEFGSSGASGLCQIVTIRDNQLYINAHGYNVLYDTITHVDSCEFDYGERIFDYIDAFKQPEKLDVLGKIKACDEFYILEGIDNYGKLQKRICCYIDGIFYLLTVSYINEETGIPIINRINYAIFEWGG